MVISKITNYRMLGYTFWDARRLAVLVPCRSGLTIAFVSWNETATDTPR